MTPYQRIILVLGAIMLAVALWTIPGFVMLQGTPIYVKISMKASKIVPKIDSGTIMMRSISVIGATILLFWAGKKN